MNLQNIILPKIGLCTAEKLYFRADKDVYYKYSGKEILFKKLGKCLFDTYYGSFSIEKWCSYTRINNAYLKLFLEGSFVIRIYNKFVSTDNKMVNELISEVDFIDKEDGEIKINLPINKKGVIYFELVCTSNDGKFIRGYYGTDIEEELPDVSLIGVICTFKREKFVLDNVAELKNNILLNENSPLKDKLQMFIVDNGNSLPNIDEDRITVFPNKNAGGAGGFTSGLMKCIDARRRENKFSHVVLMDDDIRFEAESFERLYAVLRLLKAEYKDAFIGGAMFRTDVKTKQNEMADRWDYANSKVVPIKPSVDMVNADNVVRNETAVNINYLSWWFCCIPENIIQEDNLPLPIFIKRDDIEYGLRNGKQFITLNGINVWHEPFETKRPAFLEYYYMRNQLIMEAGLDKAKKLKSIVKSLRKATLRSILVYRYQEAKLRLLGAYHFCLGIDWLKEQNDETINDYVRSKSPVFLSSDQLKIKYNDKKYKKSLAKETKKESIIRKLSLNGWLVKAKGHAVVPAVLPKPKMTHKAKKVLNYDVSNDTGFITVKSFEEAYNVLATYRKTIKFVKKNYISAVEGYRDRKGEIINYDFWQDRLSPDKTPPTHPIPDVEVVSDIKRKNQLFGYKVVRFFEKLFFFLPLKKRITVFVHGRKGFACNPKYVVLKLLEKYGDKYEIIWVSNYPNTCDEIRELGIKVIKNMTFDHMKAHLTSKVIVYNDYVPAYLIKRKGQVYINTWHGAINYKRIGYKYVLDQSKVGQKKFAMRNPQPNYIVAGSRAFRDDTANSFYFKENSFLQCGLPRNDIFFEKDKKESIVKKVKDFYGIKEDEKILLYAPTFRIGFGANAHGIDVIGLEKALNKRFDGKWRILFRSHGFVAEKLRSANGIVDASDYHDMQELIVASSALISDYSSCLWDATFADIPVFVYAPDLKNYMEKDRNFAIDFDVWPYDKATDNQTLIENIVNFNEEEYKERIKKHHQDMGSYENPNSSETIVDLIIKKLS